MKNGLTGLEKYQGSIVALHVWIVFQFKGTDVLLALTCRFARKGAFRNWSDISICILSLDLHPLRTQLLLGNYIRSHRVKNSLKFFDQVNSDLETFQRFLQVLPSDIEILLADDQLTMCGLHISPFVIVRPTSDQSYEFLLPTSQLSQIDPFIKVTDSLIFQHLLVEFINHCVNGSLSSQFLEESHLQKIYMIIDKQNTHEYVVYFYIFELVMDSEFEQKPIQLVYVTSEGKYEMHPTAEAFLRKIPKPISVISVAGLYRTGKSYLLNRILLNRNNGFGVGPTINPCTKGLWCWGTPIKGTTSDGEKINILIVDSEGIGALDEDQNHDIKIFTLAILTASVFIYNSVGSIDQTALQNLSLVVNLTKNIQLNTQETEEEDPEELARYFPTFFWVVRDFSLQLISSEGETLTPKDYLERALAPQKGFSDDVEEKNRIRRLLTAFFTERQCATLVRPLVNQQKLQQLYECSFDDLRPEFVEQALSLRKKVLTNAKPKMIKGEYLDGTMYVSMINSYLTAINNGGVPNIQNAWTYMCIQKCMKLQEMCYDFFASESEKFLRDNLPCSVNQFQSQIQDIQSQCFKIFQSQEIGEESNSYFLELKNKIKEKTNLMRIENQRESINILKNYIIKNFSVIEKKMKMNEFQTFQEYLKAINNFYLHLVENGPDLPKREIVYLDFLKKVTTQGAEIFIRQINQNLESLKNISQEKERFFKKEAEELKTKAKGQAQRYKDQIDSILSEKQDFERKYKDVGQKYEQLKVSSKTEINNLVTTFDNKLKVVEIKLGQTALNLQEMKQKKEALQTSYIFEKKEREKEKALFELKANQYKQELKSLKIKDKQQEARINELHQETTIKIRESMIQSERKTTELTEELYRLRQLYNETLETKEDLQSKLRILEKTSAQNLKKLQDDLRSQMQKFESFKNQAESQKLEQVKNLQNQNYILQTNYSEMSTLKERYEHQTNQLHERLKATEGESQKQIAILTQKIEFLNHQAAETKEKFNKSFEHYEAMLASQTEMKEEQLRKTYKTKFSEMEELHLSKINQLESELTSLKEKSQQQSLTIKKMEESHKFTFEMESKKYVNEIKNQALIIESLEEQRRKLYAEKQEMLKDFEEKIVGKDSYYQDRINILEKQLEIAVQRASEEQSELSNKSEESLKQLKNYYELEKENLQHRIANDREKYEKKFAKMREEYENQLEEEKRTAQEEYQNLKDEYNNEVSMLKELVINLQHQNDSKSKAFENIQARYEEIKLKLQKKEVDFNNRIQSLHRTNSAQKEVLQQKIIEANELRSKLQKEILVNRHHKDQIQKEKKDLQSKYASKSEQVFQLNKSIDKINNQNREKLKEINQEHMTQKLNYEQKIALNYQEKLFYINKIEDNEKEHAKNVEALEEAIRKRTAEYQEEIKVLEQKKVAQYASLEIKYEKLKKLNKENQQQMTRSINELEKQLAIQQEKFSNLFEKYQDLEEKRSSDGAYLSTQLTSTKERLSKLNKEHIQETARLKKELNQAMNEKNQIQVLYERDKILLENKNNYLEETKEKNKKEYLERIAKLQQTIDNINKNRMNEKNNYESSHSQNISKLEKKYNLIIQQNHQNWTRKERQLETTIKQLQYDLRGSNEKTSNEIQLLSQTIKNQERKIRELQQSQKRALGELQKYRTYKETSSSENQHLFQRQRETMKQKLQQKQQKYKNLEKAKQQIYYNFQKEKARWNLQKQNYLMKNDELKETITKQEKDLEKLSRENEKLKAQKKCNKLSNLSGFSRYSLQRGNSKYSLEDSITSINMSTSKQNCNPLGELSFFNNS